MSVRLGMFTMPFHHPSRDYAAILDEDREAVVLADALGFTEAYVGEHFTSWSERIADPLMFFSTVIERAPAIRFGTGVLNLPQAHPLTVAARVAQFDHLCRGRFIMGIGAGGLVSDLEAFAVTDAEARVRMLAESVDMILAIWSQDPPLDLRGQAWTISVKDGIWP